MAFQTSPGVRSTEIDATIGSSSVSTSTGGFAGQFHWGPMNELTLITNSANLIEEFQTPNDTNYEDFFTASNFLDYSGSLQVVRIANDATNASGTGVSLLIKTKDEYTALTESATHGAFAAKWAGNYGNSLKVSICTASRESKILTGTLDDNLASGTVTGTGTKFDEELFTGDLFKVGADLFMVDTITDATTMSVSSNAGSPVSISASSTATRQTKSAFSEGSNSMFGTVDVSSILTTVTGTNTKFTSQITVGDIITVAGQLKKVVSVESDTALTVDSTFLETVATQAYSRKWEFNSSFTEGAPATSSFAENNGIKYDEIHIAVEDSKGLWTGVKGQVLAKYANLSVAPGAKSDDGENVFYKDKINNTSKYIWWMDYPTIASVDMTGTTGLITANAKTYLAWGQLADTDTTGLDINEYFTSSSVHTESFSGGSDGATPTVANYQLGYDLFQSKEDVDVSLIMMGSADSIVSRYVLSTIANTRKDCVVFCSPNKSDVVNVSNSSTATDNVIQYREDLGMSTSYGVMDTGWKMMYDKYNDTLRWVPLNADIAGLCAQVDFDLGSFHSPAGFEKGRIKNSMKLAYNPKQAERDILYQKQINPVVSFPVEGTILYGDKNLLSKPSAFNRIPVRRSFITIEKTIEKDAKFNLFQFNDEFSRSQFVARTEQFFRNYGGVTDFYVLCDETNNTPEVIDANSFVGSIFVKPKHSVNFIGLNFVAVRSGVEFSEIVGQV